MEVLNGVDIHQYQTVPIVITQLDVGMIYYNGHAFTEPKLVYFQCYMMTWTCTCKCVNGMKNWHQPLMKYIVHNLGDDDYQVTF